MTKRKAKLDNDSLVLVAGAIIKYRRMIQREMDTVRAALSPGIMARQIKESAAHIAIEGQTLILLYGLSHRYIMRVMREEMAICAAPAKVKLHETK